MKFNRKIFFQGVKSKLDTSLTQDQVNGINFLLDNFETYDNYWDDLRQIAYAFATVYHETAYSFQPVAEGYYLGDKNKPNYYQGNTEKVYRFQKSLRYYPDFGRGYVQLTWSDNYKDQDKKIRQYLPEIVDDFESESGQVFSLIKNPEQAFDPKIAFAIMTIGMHFGTFRPGHTLDRYINNKKCDYVWARFIINGKKKGESLPDKSETIANYARKFESILKSSALPLEYSEGTMENKAEDNSISSELDKPIQNAEQITNIDQSAKTVPDSFVPEDKVIVAPPPSNMLDRGWKWLLGLGLIPTTGSGLIETIKNFSSDDSFSIINVFNTMKVVLLFILPYLFWIALAFIAFWGLKELLKQISFIVTQYTTARGDMHNVKVVPNTEDSASISILK